MLLMVISAVEKKRGWKGGEGGPGFGWGHSNGGFEEWLGKGTFEQRSESCRCLRKDHSCWRE